MDLKKLEGLSTEALASIRDKCAEVLRGRSEIALRSGAIGYFRDQRGVKRFMRVTRINQKTVSGYECDPETGARLGSAEARWKVSPHLLTIMGTGPKPKPVVAPAYVPKSTPGDAW
jgi:hypothetical protein